MFSNGTFMPLRRAVRAGDDGVPRVRAARGQHRARRVRIRAAGWAASLSRQTADVDARNYLRLATNGVLAFRSRGFNSWGDFPGYLYFGGNSELRGYDYLEFLGNQGVLRQRASCGSR